MSIVNFVMFHSPKVTSFYFLYSFNLLSIGDYIHSYLCQIFHIQSVGADVCFTDTPNVTSYFSSNPEKDIYNPKSNNAHRVIFPKVKPSSSESETSIELYDICMQS